MLVTVLEDEIASWVQDVPGKNLVRKCLEALEGVRRVGEDYVELLAADGQEVKDVVAHHGDVPQPQTLGLGLDEGRIRALHFDTVYAGSPARGELICDGPGPAEQVEYLEVLELVFVVEDIEKPLLGEIRGGPRLITDGRVYDLAPATSATDPRSTSTALK